MKKYLTETTNTMSNNKQSSVEWLLEQITYDNGYGQRRASFIDTEDLTSYFEQAKAMHRKEILEARQNGLDNGFANGSWDSQLYYELEFGGNNEQQ